MQPVYLLPPIENWGWLKKFEIIWVYQRSQRLWAFINIVAPNVSAKEYLYAEKLSYHVLKFASTRGNVVREVFLFEAYVVSKNIIFLFDILLVII